MLNPLLATPTVILKDLLIQISQNLPGGWAVCERPLALRARLATGVPFSRAARLSVNGGASRTSLIDWDKSQL
jgi:hypothetical protein